MEFTSDQHYLGFDVNIRVHQENGLGVCEFDFRFKELPKRNGACTIDAYLQDHDIKFNRERGYTGPGWLTVHKERAAQDVYILTDGNARIKESREEPSSSLKAISIESYGNTFEGAIARAKKACYVMSDYIAYLGYDASVFRKFVEIFDEKKIVNATNSVYSEQGTSAENVLNRVTTVFREMFSRLGSVTFGNVVTTRSNNAAIPVHVSASDKPGEDAIVLKRDDGSTLKYKRQGFPTSDEYIFPMMFKRDIEVPSSINDMLTDDEADEVYTESVFFFNRANALMQANDYASALRDMIRDVRIIDWLLTHVRENDARLPLREKFLVNRASDELVKAKCGVDLLISLRKYSMALDYLERAIDFFAHFYEQVHVLVAPGYDDDDFAPSFIHGNKSWYERRHSAEEWFSLHGPALQIKQNVHRTLSILKQKIDTVMSKDSGLLSDGSPLELTLDEQLAFFIKEEEFEAAARIRDLIRRRNLVDPLELFPELLKKELEVEFGRVAYPPFF